MGRGRGVKGKKKMAQNDKNSCCFTLYLRNRLLYYFDFSYTCAKGGQGQKMTKNFQFQSITLFISGSVDHIMESFGLQV